MDLKELISLANELTRQPLTLKESFFLGSKRLYLSFHSLALLIDWDPHFAYCLLLKEQLTNPFSLKVNSSNDDLEELKQNAWQKRLHHLRLQEAWVSSEKSLHLLFQHPQKDHTCEFLVRLYAKKPNLYWIENSLEESFLPTSFKPFEPLIRLESEHPYPYQLAYEHWIKLQAVYQKDLQEKVIHEHYKLSITTTEKRIQKIKSKLEALEEEEALIHQGQLLQASRHLYEPQMTSIELYDWKLESLRTLELTDEPIQEQIKNLFHRAKGVRSHENQLRQQLKVLEGKLAHYKKDLEHDLSLGYLSAPATLKKAAPQKTQEQPAKPYRCFSYQGAKIYVGKKASDNLIVSFHIAHGNDLWLHVADYPGSHIVVKSAEITPKIMKAASLLAHHYSQARKLASVEVTYTQAKWIKKIPGSKTGTVGVVQSKRYLSHYDELLLKELLESQEPPV